MLYLLRLQGGLPIPSHLSHMLLRWGGLPLAAGRTIVIAMGGEDTPPAPADAAVVAGGWVPPPPSGPESCCRGSTPSRPIGRAVAVAGGVTPGASVA
jgi:hypothetical protein